MDPSALILSEVVIAALFILRCISLLILEDAPDYDDRQRYIRGARWGWWLGVASFIGVVVAVTVVFDHTAWGFRETSLAWVAGLLPIGGSIGLLMIPEFLGHWVWAQVAWDALGGRKIDWMRYRAVTSHVMTNRARWMYYAAWVVGSAALTAGPLWTSVIVQAG